jgi:bacteriocin-like protein
MVKPNSEGQAREHDELSTDELNAVSGGSIEIREVIIKAAVEAVHVPPLPAGPKPIPMPYPNQGSKE